MGRADLRAVGRRRWVLRLAGSRQATNGLHRTRLYLVGKRGRLRLGIGSWFRLQNCSSYSASRSSWALSQSSFAESVHSMKRRRDRAPNRSPPQLTLRTSPRVRQSTASESQAVGAFSSLWSRESPAGSSCVWADVTKRTPACGRGRTTTRLLRLRERPHSRARRGSAVALRHGGTPWGREPSPPIRRQAPHGPDQPRCITAWATSVRRRGSR